MRAPPNRALRRLGAALVVAAAILAVAGLLAFASPFLSLGTSARTAAAAEQKRGDAAALAALPVPVAPAFVPGKPVFLGSSSHVSRWAVVRSAVRPRVAPRQTARPLDVVSTRTPEGTSNIVVVLARRLDAAGRLWIRARLPSLGEEKSTGWIPRDALGGYGTVRTRLIVDLHTLKATLLRDGRPIFRADVGVGRPSWPTPKGEFYIRNRLSGYVSPAYGPLAFGTSARSRILTDWPAGGFVGIHGTDRPDLLPGYISHGCIRMRNHDIMRLAKLMPVGTPLTIR